MRHVSPFVRGIVVIAVIALVIVLLDAETALATASLLLSAAFVIAIGVVVYFLWRDIGRHEIATWPDRLQWVFYGAGGLLLVDVVWWFWWAPSGRDALSGILVAAICVYVGLRTWQGQRRY